MVEDSNWLSWLEELYGVVKVEKDIEAFDFEWKKNC